MTAEALSTIGERIRLPQVGDVIVCEAFANGWRQLIRPNVWQEGPVWVTDAPELRGAIQDCNDAWRAEASFVVEESRLSDVTVSWTHHWRGGGYGDPDHYEEDRHGHAWHVIARRLAGDESFDPEGEAIQFLLWGEGSVEGGNQSERVMHEGDKLKRQNSVLDTPIYKLRTMQRIVRFV